MEQEGIFPPILKKTNQGYPLGTSTSSSSEQPKDQQIHSEMSDILRISTGKDVPLYILYQSFDQFEEDLAQMDLLGKTLIDKDQYREIAGAAAKQVLRRIGKHVRPEVLYKLFPGLNLEKLDDFDIRNSRLYWRVLSDRDYKNFRWEYESGVNLEERIFLTHPTAG